MYNKTFWSTCTNFLLQMDREKPHTDFQYSLQERFVYEKPIKRNKHYTFEPVE